MAQYIVHAIMSCYDFDVIHDIIISHKTTLTILTTLTVVTWCQD